MSIILDEQWGLNWNDNNGDLHGSSEDLPNLKFFINDGILNIKQLQSFPLGKLHSLIVGAFGIENQTFSQYAVKQNPLESCIIERKLSPISPLLQALAYLELIKESKNTEIENSSLMSQIFTKITITMRRLEISRVIRID